MPTTTYSQAERLLRIQTQLGETELFLEEFTGIEAVSRPFIFRLTLLSPSDTLNMKSLLRTPITITVGADRKFHGIFASITQAKQRSQVVSEQAASELIAYQAVVVPKFWFLSLDSKCRIFQNLSVPDIVKKLLGEAGITDYQVTLQGTYAAREYCVQYRESTLNFISRLLEEEGIFYFFKHEDGKHTMMFADASSTQAKSPAESVAYAYGHGDAFEGAGGQVVDLERLEQVHTGKIALGDYSFLKPLINLGVSLAGEGQEEAYDYPGRYQEISDGDRYARVRLEEREAMQFLVSGNSTCATFEPGYIFTLAEHPREDNNQDYFLTSVTHDAVDATYRSGKGVATKYENTFRAIPKTVPFRPMRTARKPFVQGPQTALVVGKAGEEIWVDSYGRVKVQFYWDREGQKNENSSCWVRVSQIWAGKNWGWMTIPRIGQEVVVDFLEGDPDRPLITGRVYNADQMPPYTLPANQTQSGIKSRSSKQGTTENYNEIQFEDLKGSEQINIHAEKDMNTVVENNDTQTVQVNRTITVSGTHTETITKDTTIKITEGNHSLTIDKGNQTITVTTGNQDTKVSTGNQSVTISTGNQTTTVSLGKIDTSAMQSITLTVGQNSIKIDQTGVTIQGLMVKIKGTTIVQVEGSALLQLKGGITMIN